MPIEKGPHAGERGFWSDEHQDWVTFDFIGRRIVPVSDWPRIRDAFTDWFDRHFAGRPLRPMIISDDLKAGVNGLFHPGTGKHTDSKSHFRQMTRESGCIEIGDEHHVGERKQLDDPGADIKRTLEELGA